MKQSHQIIDINEGNLLETAAKLRGFEAFAELDDSAMRILLENAVIIKSAQYTVELEEARALICGKNENFLRLIASGKELFIPTVMLEGSLSYCAPGFKKDDGIQLFEMHAPYFAVDHFTPVKQYDDDYVVFLSPNSEILILNPENFEKIADAYVGLYRYGLKDKTRLSTAMALSYSALMAPTALLRVARWFRFSAGQRIAQGMPPTLENNSQEKIARFLGISRTTLAGAIRTLRERGAVHTHYRTIKVDVDKLTLAIEQLINEEGGSERLLP